MEKTPAFRVLCLSKILEIGQFLVPSNLEYDYLDIFSLGPICAKQISWIYIAWQMHGKQEKRLRTIHWRHGPRNIVYALIYQNRSCVCVSDIDTCGYLLLYISSTARVAER